MRLIAASLAALAFVSALVIAFTREPAPMDKQPVASERAPARFGAFLDAHPGTAPVKASYGWLLTDRTGIVLRREDDTIAAAILADIGPDVMVSPGARHLSYWTAEARGIRRLHVFDTVSLTPPRVLLETEAVVKIVPAYSPDERFAALSMPERAGVVRVVDLASGDATEVAVAPDLQLWSWIAEGIVFHRSGAITHVLLDPRTGATSDVAQTDPRLSRTPAPTIDPGTTAITQITGRFARPDGSAMTYLQFDASAGGRWFGERVERDGRRVPVEWTTGGNPDRAIYVGTAAVAATIRYEHAPPRDPDGKVGEARALWLFRQHVAGPVRREAVRAMRYADFVASSGSRSFQIDLDAIVYEVLIQSPAPFETRRGPIPCGAAFALMRSDDRSEGTGGGCLGPAWPTDLPPAFASAHPLDWTSPLGPGTPPPTTK